MSRISLIRRKVFAVFVVVLGSVFFFEASVGVRSAARPKTVGHSAQWAILASPTVYISLKMSRIYKFLPNKYYTYKNCLVRTLKKR